jgi:hypothetical protein
VLYCFLPVKTKLPLRYFFFCDLVDPVNKKTVLETHAPRPAFSTSISSSTSEVTRICLANKVSRSCCCTSIYHRLIQWQVFPYKNWLLIANYQRNMSEPHTVSEARSRIRSNFFSFQTNHGTELATAGGGTVVAGTELNALANVLSRQRAGHII